MSFFFIKKITVKPFERQGRHIWYPLQLQLDNHSTVEIKRRYSDFIKLYGQIQTIDKTTPKINKKKSWIKRYVQRQVELETFCKHLTGLPSFITRSDIYLRFFNLDEYEERILIKLIYNAQNIVVLRMPRSISFEILKSNIILLHILLSNHITLITCRNPASVYSVSSES